MLISDPKMTKDDAQKALAAQLAAWAYESHAWEVCGPERNQVRCLWCEEVKPLEDRVFAEELCANNPLVLELLASAS